MARLLPKQLCSQWHQHLLFYEQLLGLLEQSSVSQLSSSASLRELQRSNLHLSDLETSFKLVNIFQYRMKLSQVQLFQIQQLNEQLNKLSLSNSLAVMPQLDNEESVFA